MHSIVRCAVLTPEREKIEYMLIRRKFSLSNHECILVLKEGSGDSSIELSALLFETEEEGFV